MKDSYDINVQAVKTSEGKAAIGMQCMWSWLKYESPIL